MTTRNIASLAAPIRLLHGDYRALLGQHLFPANHRIVAFLAPPWADALKADTGLDLGRTKPPVGEIVDDFEHAYPDSPILYVIEVHEHLVPEPLAELRARFDWSELSIYEIAGPTWPARRPARHQTMAGIAGKLSKKRNCTLTQCRVAAAPECPLRHGHGFTALQPWPIAFAAWLVSH